MPESAQKSSNLQSGVVVELVVAVVEFVVEDLDVAVVAVLDVDEAFVCVDIAKMKFVEMLISNYLHSNNYLHYSPKV